VGIEEEKNQVVMERQRIVLEQNKLSKIQTLKKENEELHRQVSMKGSSKEVGAEVDIKMH